MENIHNSSVMKFLFQTYWQTPGTASFEGTGIGCSKQTSLDRYKNRIIIILC